MLFTPERHAEVNAELQRIHAYLEALVSEVNEALPPIDKDGFTYLAVALAAEHAQRACHCLAEYQRRGYELRPPSGSPA
jgi:hypothetical protein